MSPTLMSRASPTAVEPFYFGPASHPLFGCHGAPPHGPTRDCGIVLCPPIGSEYFRSHRALRQLAARLIGLGFAVLRFDYSSTGDSPGLAEDGRLDRWRRDVAAACDEMRRRGFEDVGLVGLRLGGTLAWLAGADGCGVDRMVLWDPVIDGRKHLGELEDQQREMLHARGVRPEPRDSGPPPVEVLGFPLTDVLRADLERIDLLADSRKPSRSALVIGSEGDLDADRLVAHLGTLDVAADRRELTGHAFWVQERESALVPHQALQAITAWVSEAGGSGAGPARDVSSSPGEDRPDLDAPAAREQAIVFGQANPLVGVVTDPPETGGEGPARPPACLFLNAGFVHHVGPNRLYVAAARQLASAGFVGLRFDFSGIGDSPTRSDHLPFEESAVGEVREAMDWLSAARSADRFLLLGLCSGATFALQAAAEDPRVAGVVLINFQGGLDQEARSYVTQRSEARYLWRVSLFSTRSWRRLLSGGADYRGLLRRIGARLGRISGRREPESAGITADRARLRALADRGSRVLVIYSDADPGRDYMNKILGRGGVPAGLTSATISRADHIFTQPDAQQDLLRAVAHWTAEYPPPPPTS